MDRTRKVSRRRGNRTEMVSPIRISRPAWASCPLTMTRPASHVAFASVRRRITRLHFKNRSRRMRSIQRKLFGCGNFLRLFRRAGIGVSLGSFDETVDAQFRKIFLGLCRNSFFPQNVLDLFLREF